MMAPEGAILDHFLKFQFLRFFRLSTVYYLLLGSCESSHFLIMKCLALQVINYWQLNWILKYLSCMHIFNFLKYLKFVAFKIAILLVSAGEDYSLCWTGFHSKWSWPWSVRVMPNRKVKFLTFGECTELFVWYSLIQNRNFLEGRGSTVWGL